MKLKTKQIFYFPRFWQYARAHWSEKKRPYFWHFAIIVMIYFLILMMANHSYRTINQSQLYYTGLIITGFIFSLRYFSALAKPESALLELMRPASSLEKWLLAIIITMILYPVIYTVLFLPMTAPLSWLSMQKHSQHYADSYQLFIPLREIIFTAYYEDALTAKGQMPFWLAFWGINSYALVTSVLFKRLPIVKSVVLAFFLFLIFLLLGLSVKADLEKFTQYWFDSKTYIPNTQAFILGLLWWIVAPLLMFFAGLFALRGRDL